VDNGLGKIDDVKFSINDGLTTTSFTYMFIIPIPEMDVAFLNFLTAMNTDLYMNTNITSQIYEQELKYFTPIYNNFFNLSYNNVPLDDGDETYTYLTFSGNKGSSYTSNSTIPENSKIYGIKPSSDYVELKNEKGSDLKNTLEVSNEKIKNGYYPLIVNSYAAKKYGIKAGDKINVKITNTADRFDSTSGNDVSFTVSGISKGYIGEEYYTSQDVANYLLGLKTHVNDGVDYDVEPNSYYIDSQSYTDSNDTSTAAALGGNFDGNANT
jgi:hypothetical protein